MSGRKIEIGCQHGKEGCLTTRGLNAYEGLNIKFRWGGCKDFEDGCLDYVYRVGHSFVLVMYASLYWINAGSHLIKLTTYLPFFTLVVLFVQNY